MFRHIYVNRLKCLARERGLVFWTLMYPIVLAFFFNLAFSNISSAESFRSIPISVVESAELRSQPSFIDALNYKGSSEKLFNVTFSTREEADKSLENGKIKGYIFFDNGAHVVLNNSGVQQNIIKEFMDTYLQTASAYTTIIKQNPAQHPAEISGQSYLENITFGRKANPNTMVAYFYALIAMAAMFGCFWGENEVKHVQADLSSLGARMNMTPVHKLKALFFSFCAALTIHFLSMLILVAVLNLVLRVDFGEQIGFIILVCFFGSLAGISFGAFLSAVIRKGKENLRTPIMIMVSLIMSSLAGLNNINIKYAVTSALPAMAYVNPANLIADSFYALYYYTSYERFFLNIALLFAISLFFLLVVYFSTRRQKYASI